MVKVEIKSNKANFPKPYPDVLDVQSHWAQRHSNSVSLININILNFNYKAKHSY